MDLVLWQAAMRLPVALTAKPLVPTPASQTSQWPSM